MMARKRKQREPSFRSNTTDPTATWKTKVRPNKSFGFSRRTKTDKAAVTASEIEAALPSTFVNPGGGGLKRFQKRRQSNPHDQKEKNDGSYNSNSNIKNDDEVEKYRVTPFGNTIGNGDPLSSFSCGEQKKSGSPTAATSSKTITTDSEATADKNLDASFSSSKSNKQILQTTEDRHSSLPRANANLAALFALHDNTVITDTCGIEKSVGGEGISCYQEATTVNRKMKKTAAVLTMTSTGTYSKKNPIGNTPTADKLCLTPSKQTNLSGSNKNNPAGKNPAADTLCLAPSKQTILSRSNKINPTKNHCSIDAVNCLPRESSEFNSKMTKSKVNLPNAKAKKTTPKVQQKSNRREATPFVYPTVSLGINNTNEFHAGPKTSLQYRTDPGHRNRNRNRMGLTVDKNDREFCIRNCVPKNKDQANNGEEYGCNHRYDQDVKPSRKESKKAGRSHPTYSLHLSEANLLAISRRETSGIKERASRGQGEGSGKKEEGTNVPKTSLFRSQTESSTDIMGVSPHAEFHRRAASVDEALSNDNRRLSSLAATGSEKPWAAMTNAQQDLPLQTPYHHYHHMSFSSQATKGDSDSSASPSGESDDGHYYSKFRRYGHPPAASKPIQLLDKFNAVSTAEALAETPNAVPKYILRVQRRKSKSHLKSRNKASNTAGHPLSRTTAVLDEMIATALKSKKKAKPKKSKRKSGRLARNVTGKGHDTSVNKNRKSEAFKRKDRIIAPPPKRTKLFLDLDDDMSTTRNDARRVSLESPPPANSGHPRQELPTTANLSRKRKKLAFEDDSSSCWSEERHQTQVGFVGSDDMSSDWSADWDNLSIESIPRPRCHQREDSDGRLYVADHYAEDASDDEEENWNASFVPKPSVRRARCKENAGKNRYLEKTGNQLATSDNTTRRNTNFYPGGKLSGQFSTGVFLAVNSIVTRVFANCRSSSDSAGGVKKVSVITHRSIRCIIFLLYVYAVFWVGYDPCNRLSVRNRSSSSFGGIINHRRLRPRIWFSENPSLCLVQASPMYEAATM